jgi:hypothetical protein
MKTEKRAYKPYTYRILFKPTGQEYYGVQTKQGARPENLLVNYFTSSKVVKALMAEHGKEAFEVVGFKVHATKEAALKWEELFLVSVGAAQNEHWLNQWNGGHKFCITAESAKKIGESNRAIWAKPGVKEARSEVLKAGWAKPGVKEAQSELIKSRNAKPEVKDAMCKGQKARYAEHPEALEALQEASKAHWAKPESREAMSEIKKAHWAKPESREAMSEIKKAHCALPGVREEMSERTKAQFSAPGAREAAREVANSQWAKPGAREAQSELKIAFNAEHPEAAEAHSARMIAYNAENPQPKGAESPHAKTYKITFPDGIVQIIKGLNAFCIDHGLNQGALSQVAKGKYKHHHYFKCEYVTE